MHRFGISFVVVVAVFMGVMGAARAQETSDDPMRDLKHLPQADDRLPPTPLTSGQELEVLDAVFSRFPNVDRHAMMAYIAEHDPEEMQRYTVLSMHNLGEALTLLMGLVRDNVALQDLEARNPEQYARVVRVQRLERNLRQLAAAEPAAAGPGLEAQLAELKRVLADAFEAKQEVMRGDVAEIQRQVNELQALLDQREQHRDAIIAKRLVELSGQAVAQNW